MRRRSLMLAGAATLTLPLRAASQTLDAAGCAVGFSNGMLQFSPDCALLTVPGLGFGVAPPSHLVDPLDGEATTDVSTPQEERQLQLQAKRDKKRTQQARQHDRHTDKQDDKRRRRKRRRDRRAASQATATPTTDATE